MNVEFHSALSLTEMYQKLYAKMLSVNNFSKIWIYQARISTFGSLPHVINGARAIIYHGSSAVFHIQLKRINCYAGELL